MENSREAQVDPREALAAFGVEPLAVSLLLSGRMNRHWRVETAEGPLVLRRYTSLRSNAAIAWEHDLITYIGERKWPVAEPIAVATTTLLSVGEARFALFPALPGEPAPPESVPSKRIKGRLLARLHDDLAAYPHDGQREGFGRSWELDLFLQPATGESFNALLARFGHDYPDTARAVRAQRYRSLRELSRLGYGDLPWAIAHADFHNENMLFEDGSLSALLDFDSARWDSRAFDIAASLALECLAAPEYNAIEPRLAEAFLAGYSSQRPLQETEAELIVPLVRAWQLTFVALRLTQWALDLQPDAAMSIIRTVRGRFAALDQCGDALTVLARAATQPAP